MADTRDSHIYLIQQHTRPPTEDGKEGQMTRKASITKLLSIEEEKKGVLLGVSMMRVTFRCINNFYSYILKDSITNVVK